MYATDVPYVGTIDIVPACSSAMVKASNVPLIHACITASSMHACSVDIVHACFASRVNTGTKTIVNECTQVKVHACIVAMVHAMRYGYITLMSNRYSTCTYYSGRACM